MDVVEFQAITHPDHFIRHRNGLGELTRKEGQADDFRFALVPRGQQARMALRSKNFPQLFLRHRDFRVHLEGPAGENDRQFAADATFLLVPGLADPDAISLQASNFDDRFLRHRDFHLFVEPLESPEATRDATFVKQFPSVTIDQGTALEPADG
jgi:Alpha-L-arabinofuranosidase B (ABFB) domain